jgi:hypothetical protein
MDPGDELIGCPNGLCRNGIVDTGGVTPWDTPINAVCSRCQGRGVVTRRDYEEELRSMARAERLAAEEVKSVL